jgi:hypothetical protein
VQNAIDIISARLDNSSQVHRFIHRLPIALKQETKKHKMISTLSPPSQEHINVNYKKKITKKLVHYVVLNCITLQYCYQHKTCKY